jgi:hypothetical protein
MRPLLCGTDDFKTDTDVKIAGDLVIGAGVNPNLSATYNSGVSGQGINRGPARINRLRLLNSHALRVGVFSRASRGSLKNRG